MTEPLLDFFRFQMMPPPMAAVSKPFYDAACELVDTVPTIPERTAVLRKLLLARDAALEAVLTMELLKQHRGYDSSAHNARGNATYAVLGHSGTMA